MIDNIKKGFDISSKLYYGLIIASFSISRLFFLFMGIRINPFIDVMHYLSEDLLRERLFESLLHIHNFPPLMNLLLGIELKISDHNMILSSVLFLILGLIGSLSFGFILKQLFTSDTISLLMVFFYQLLPQTIFFENLFFHTYPSAQLVLFTYALFFHAIKNPSSVYRWFFMFLVLMVLAYLRSIFHLYLLFIILIGIIYHFKKYRREIVLGALIPLLVVSGLYVKNSIHFGFFGSSSWLGNSLVKQTFYRLDPTIRSELIANGLVSEHCKYRIFDTPSTLTDFIDPANNTGIPALDELSRSRGYGNYNHWIYLKLSETNIENAKYVLKEYPAVYIKTVARATLDFFKASSTWHPAEPRYSPHEEIRKRIGFYERLYNQMFHPYKVGIYLILLPLCFLTFVVTFIGYLDKDKRSNVMLFFLGGCLVVFFVLTVSVLVEYGELERIRYLIEAFIWILARQGIVILYNWKKGLKYASSRAGISERNNGGISVDI